MRQPKPWFAAVLAAAFIASQGPGWAEPLEAVRVLDLGSLERWRAVGTLSSSVTGARIVILEQESTGRSKTARIGGTPMNGVKVLSISPGDVILEVQGRPVRLEVTRGGGATALAPAAALETAARESEPALPPSTGPRRLRLTLEEFHEAANVLRRAFVSGDIGLGENDDGVFGVLIENAPPGGIVERLGLRPGDVVVAINGAPAANENAAFGLLDAAAPGQSLPFAFRRGRQVGQGAVEIAP